MMPYSHDTFGHIDGNRVFGCVYAGGGRRLI